MYATRGIKGFADKVYGTDKTLYKFTYTRFINRLDKISETEFVDILATFFDNKTVEVARKHILYNETFKNIGDDLGVTLACTSKKFSDMVDRIRDSEVIFRAIMYGKKCAVKENIKTPVNTIGLNTKTINALHKSNIYYIEDITSFNDVVRLMDNGKAFGEACLRDLLTTLAKLNYGIKKID